jgi:hypothetical protein
MSMRFKQALGESACTCSPFSGNEGSCCNGTDKCEHWGASLECGVGDLKGERGNRLHDTGLTWHTMVTVGLDVVA